MAPAPALLMRASTRPQVSTAVAIVRLASSAEAVSATRPVMFACSAAVSSMGPGRRPVTSTLSPCLARRSAAARPMPELPPVTITTFSFRMFEFLLRGPAAIDGDRGARDLVRRGRAQEGHRAAELCRRDKIQRGLLFRQQLVGRLLLADMPVRGDVADLLFDQR